MFGRGYERDESNESDERKNEINLFIMKENFSMSLVKFFCKSSNEKMSGERIVIETFGLFIKKIDFRFKVILCMYVYIHN